MNKSIIAFAAFATALVATAAQGDDGRLHVASGYTEDATNYVVGLYSTSEGQMSLWRDPDTRRWVGEYGDDGGRIDALMTEIDYMSGYWMENNSDVRCATERGGTYYWGRMSFSWAKKYLPGTNMPLPQAPGSFSGGWSYCDTWPPDHGWTGVRLEAKG